MNDNLTKEQKASIIRYLLSIAKADGQVHNKKMEYVLSLSADLDFNMDDPVLVSSFQQGIGPMIENLKRLPDGKKKWLVNSVKQLLRINGSINDNEFKYASGVLGHVGISDNLLA